MKMWHLGPLFFFSKSKGICFKRFCGGPLSLDILLHSHNGSNNSSNCYVMNDVLYRMRVIHRVSEKTVPVLFFE